MINKYINEIENNKDRIFRISDSLWDHPELRFQENFAAELLKQELMQEGFEICCDNSELKTSFIAKYGSGSPKIGILAEYDALAGMSQQSGAFQKEILMENAAGHGCGHNLLGAGAFAAALAVKRYLEDNKNRGTLVFYGCPGEEGGSGKAFMAREGAFDDLDIALTWHPAEITDVRHNSTLANLQAVYEFHGISSHAAESPEAGRSALDAAELMNVGTNYLREHMISDARVHYSYLNSGGESPNVVQDYSKLLYLIRAPKLYQVKELYERINKIALGMAMATETNCNYYIVKTCANVIPNRQLEKVLYENMKKIPYPEYSEEEYAYADKYSNCSDNKNMSALERIWPYFLDEENKYYVKGKESDPLYDFIVPYEENQPVRVEMGSMDVGDVSYFCPTAQIRVCTWAAKSGGHSWQITAQGKSSIAHKGLLYAGKVLSSTMIQLFEEPELILMAKKEFENKMKEEEYIYISKEIKPMVGF